MKSMYRLPRSILRMAPRMEATRWLSSKVSDGISASLFKNPIVNQLWTERQQAKEKLSSTAATKCVLAKPPSDSHVEISYPFSTDELLWSAYSNPWGQIRIGRLLEDLDALAGNIAFFHVNDGADKYPTIVTASVDRIQVHSRPKQGSDQQLSGRVTWTGTSSMEIRMQCKDVFDDSVWLEAYVTFVTLDPDSKKPMKITPLSPQSDAEKAEFDKGAARAALKKQRRKDHKSPPSEVEAMISTKAKALLDEASPLLTMPSLADSRCMLLKGTHIQNALVAQPQLQNLHGRIFGGFLMRRAFELAFSNAYLFGGVRPIFCETDEVSFSAPVDVGDLVVFNSKILYTKLSRVHVMVEAWVTVPEDVTAKLSNSFFFTFELNSNIKKVLPSNMDEARLIASRMYIDEEQDKS